MAAVGEDGDLVPVGADNPQARAFEEVDYQLPVCYPETTAVEFQEAFCEGLDRAQAVSEAPLGGQDGGSGRLASLGASALRGMEEFCGGLHRVAQYLARRQHQRPLVAINDE